MKAYPPDFVGFAPPTEQYFSLPNEWVNICAHITNLAELKVILYIARHTWGYHEYDVAKPFTLDEFVRGRKRKDGTRMDAGAGLSADAGDAENMRAAHERLCNGPGFLTQGFIDFNIEIYYP